MLTSYGALMTNPVTPVVPAEIAPEGSAAAPAPTTTVTPADLAAQANAGGAAVVETPAAVTEFKAITSQEEFDRRIGQRIGQIEAKYPNYDELKAKAEKYDDSERAKLGEIEQKDLTIGELQQKIAEFETREQERQFNDLRTGVARAKGLPEALAARLTGTTKEELEADADSLLSLVPAQPVAVATQTPEPVGGGAPPVAGTNESKDDGLVERLMREGF
ncbi:scaffolding protein [Gordonia phage Kudefre]|nr:head scaffolding protein [Gordonia phage Kudefre]UDL15250.1 scaffolding protein [Gordonia phage Kudefre]